MSYLDQSVEDVTDASYEYESTWIPRLPGDVDEPERSTRRHHPRAHRCEHRLLELGLGLVRPRSLTIIVSGLGLALIISSFARIVVGFPITGSVRHYDLSD